MLYSKFFKGVSEGKELRIAVLHRDALDEVQKLAERIEKVYSPVEMIINMMGPVLGINTGPGALALCGYVEG